MARKRKKVKRRKKSAKRRKKARNQRLGTGARFKALVKKLEKRGDVRDPRAVAAAIGRKKYGKKKFQKLAQQGRWRAKAKKARKKRIKARRRGARRRVAANPQMKTLLGWGLAAAAGWYFYNRYKNQA